MIIVTTPGVTDAQLDRIRERIEALGLRTHLSRGEQRTIIGCIGDEALLSDAGLLNLAGVESVTPVLKPYKLAAREFAPAGTVVRFVDAAGGAMLRGGAFKPRTSPYAFQGLGLAALRMLSDVRSTTGVPVVSEVMDTRQVELVAEHVDMLQVGARSMQNFALLAEVGRTQRPVLLKRGLSATINELLMAAEYIMAQGNQNVVVCERGIRTFETATRNTLDIAAIPVLKRETHLPVIVDPSHAGGRADLVLPLALAAIAAGADGLIIEVHPHPEQALSDGDQSITLPMFRDLMHHVASYATVAGRTLAFPIAPAEAAA